MVTKEMMNNSIEATLRKRNIRILLIGFTVLFFVYLGIYISSGLPFDSIFFILLVLIFGICGGFVLFQWLYYHSLFSNIEGYKLYEVMLDRPTASYLYKGYVYFTITIESEEGIRIYRKTKALWSDYIGSKYKVWEYMNSKVWIAYNEERDRLVVLGLEDDWRGTNERNYSNE